MKNLRPFLVPLILAAAPAFAAGTPWHSVAASSSITWVASWQGNAVKGRFSKFSITASQLDPQKPAGAHLHMSLDTRSITAGSPDITQALRGVEWFAVDKHPTASYEGHIVEPNGKPELDGKLKIKNHSRPLRFPLTITPQGKNLLLKGQFTLQRNDFGIGTGQWSSGKTIAHTVTVKFSVVIAPGHAG